MKLELLLFFLLLLSSCTKEKYIHINYDDTIIKIYDAKCPGYSCNLIKIKGKKNSARILTECRGDDRLYVSKETYNFYGIGITGKINSTAYLSYNDTILTKSTSVIISTSKIEEIAFKKAFDYMNNIASCKGNDITKIIGFVKLEDIIKQ